jgi:hypothetical protein
VNQATGYRFTSPVSALHIATAVEGHAERNSTDVCTPDGTDCRGIRSNANRGKKSPAAIEGLLDHLATAIVARADGQASRRSSTGSTRLTPLFGLTRINPDETCLPPV